MDFGKAIEAVKNGKKIKRTGWNGQDQYVELVSHVSYRRPNGEVVNATNLSIGNKALLFHGTLGDQVGWLASQGDMLSDDWVVVD